MEEAQGDGLHGEKKTSCYREADPLQRWLFVRYIEEVGRGREVYWMDECGIPHGLYKERGWSPRGERIVQEVSGKARKRTSVIGAWRRGRLVAPAVFEGSCDSAVVDAYFEQVLLPAIPRGSVVVLDNASFHHSSQAKLLAQAHGVELVFLPPYSPDLNPIESFWAKLKRALRPLLPLSTDPFSLISNMCLCYV